jgi:hypothetical protein
VKMLERQRVQKEAADAAKKLEDATKEAEETARAAAAAAATMSSTQRRVRVESEEKLIDDQEAEGLVRNSLPGYEKITYFVKNSFHTVKCVFEPSGTLIIPES